ncbi:MAG: tail fiber domain-containing protein, partial [Candidatus Omnitrophota bacterium]
NDEYLGFKVYAGAIGENFDTNTPQMVLHKGGNVGIGTDAPGAKLDIKKDNVAATAWTPNLVINYGYTGIGANGLRIRTDQQDINYDIFGYDHTSSNDEYLGFKVYAGAIGENFDTNTPQMVLHKGGNVGIGTDAPAVKLSVVGGRIAQDTWTADGDVAVQYDTGGTNALGIATSDRRLKKNFEPLTDSLDKTLQIEGLLYHDKDQEDSEKKKLGLIAQDVMEVMPEAVFAYHNEETDEEYYGVHYERLSVLLIEAIKEQQAEIAELRDRVAVLEART